MAQHPTQAPMADQRLAVPSIDSQAVNDACWTFVEAMPHQLPGPVFNDLKPALHAAFCNLLQAMPGHSQAARDVLAERQRQVEVEGWTHEHDDEHQPGEMSLAGALYVLHGGVKGCPPGRAPGGWPWAAQWWKPKDRRSTLVRAAALVLAEVERMDRAAARNAAGGTHA